MISKKLSSLGSKALFPLTCLTLLMSAVAKPAAAAPGWAYRTDRIVAGSRECLRNGQATLGKLGINAQTSGNEVHGYTRDGKNVAFIFCMDTPETRGSYSMTQVLMLVTGDNQNETSRLLDIINRKLPRPQPID